MKLSCRPLVAAPLLRSKYLQRTPRVTLISRQYSGNIENPPHSVRPEKCWRKQFTITTQSASTLKPDDILTKINEVQNSFEWERYKSLLGNTEKTVVILSTPSFATWLENGLFIPNILQAIFPTAPDAMEVQTILGVVDGLAPPDISDLDGNGITPTEGFGVSVILSKSREPQGEHKNNQSTPNLGSNPAESSSITVRIYDSAAVEHMSINPKRTDITIPLANTTFRNGRTSTLLGARWERSSLQHPFKQIESSELESWTVSEAYSGKLFENSTSVPLTPITETRHLASGLGNIVRTLTGASGKEVPASRELEENVISYLSSRGLPEQTVGIWALVFPAEVYENDLGNWTQNYPTRIWNAVRHGASLHRVVSGGGGWGIKAGLLSLDPETRFGYAEARYDFSQLGSALDSEAEQTRALGEIAKPGSYIQFLIAHQPLDKLVAPEAPINEVESSKVCQLGSAAPSFLLGCIPSTIDDIPVQPPETTSDDAPPELTVTYNQLSILSEKGLYLCREEVAQTNKPAHFTRLNMSGAAIRGKVETES